MVTEEGSGIDHFNEKGPWPCSSWDVFIGNYIFKEGEPEELFLNK